MRICDKCKKKLRKGDGNSHIELGYSFTYDLCLKSEVDKAIAEQKDKLQNVSSLLKETREWLVESQKLHKRCADNAVKVIRHNKYKRCLKNREICVMRFDIEIARQYPTRTAFWAKWERKWLELAEKFKEAK